jgi:hypothetical protein
MGSRYGIFGKRSEQDPDPNPEPKPLKTIQIQTYYRVVRGQGHDIGTKYFDKNEQF